MRQASVTIPETLWLDLAKYALLADTSDPQLQSIQKRCIQGIQTKVERIAAHDAYTRYKTAPTDQQREQARQEYLDRVGIPESFRW